MIHPDSWRTATKWTFTLIAVAITTALFFSAITASPYLYDDLLNKDIRLTSSQEGLTLFDQIVKYTSGWMGAEGRFFPGSLGWSFSIFWVFNSLMSYKLVVATVVALSIAAFSWLIGLLLRSTQAALLTWLSLIFFCEIRYWFDGITSFAALVPLTILFVSLSIIIAISSSKWWAISLSGILFLLPLLTYEVVILFAPLVIGSIYLRSRSWIRALGVIFSTLSIAIFSLILRVNLGTHSPSVAYTISLDMGSFTETFIEQFLAAIPFSQWVLAGELPPTHLLKFLGIICVLAFIPAVFGIYFLLNSNNNIQRGGIAALLFSGVWIWVSSSALVALSGRWQNELVLGQGYLSVIYEYFGLGLIITALALTFSKAVRNLKVRTSTRFLILISISSICALLLCLALSANYVVVNA